MVTTNVIDPNDHSGQQPLEIDFRVRTDSRSPVMADLSAAGIWLAIEERDQFTACLGQNNENVFLLIAHLDDPRRQLVETK